jgi:hypothetical protein
MLWSIDNRVGRLLEIVMESRLSLDEVSQFRTRMWSVLSGIDGRAVVFADMRRSELFSPEVSDKLLVMLKNDNPKVERSAYLIHAHASFAMQLERLIRDAAHAAERDGKRAPPRQTFRDHKQALSWLAEVLADDERARLAAIVAAM